MNKTIDKLGRIVIPINLRKKYNLITGMEVRFVELEGEIAIIPNNPTCRLCKKDLPEMKNLPLCQECITQIKNCRE